MSETEHLSQQTVFMAQRPPQHFSAPVINQQREMVFLDAYNGNPADGRSIAMENQQNCIGKIEFCLGLGASLFAILGTVCVAAWTINSSINDSANNTRAELTQTINTTRTELSARLDRVEDKMDRIDSKTDSKLDQILTQVTVMQHSVSGK